MRYALLLAASALLLSGAGCDKLRTVGDGRAEQSPPRRKLTAEQREQLAARLCSSPGTYERLKVAAFRQAARVRGTDSAPFDRLAAFATVRMEEPLVVAGDRAPSLVRCSARMAIDLPPGTAAINGARSLASDISFAGQPAADGSGLVWTLSAAEPIVYPLATLRRITGEEFLPPPIARVPEDPAPENMAQSVEPMRPAEPEVTSPAPVQPTVPVRQAQTPRPSQSVQPKAAPAAPAPVAKAPAKTAPKALKHEPAPREVRPKAHAGHEATKSAEHHNAKLAHPAREPEHAKAKRPIATKEHASAKPAAHGLTAKEQRQKAAPRIKEGVRHQSTKPEPHSAKRPTLPAKPKPKAPTAPHKTTAPAPRAAPAPVARRIAAPPRARSAEQPSAPRRVAPSRRGRPRFENDGYGYDPYRYPPPPPPRDDDGGY